MGYGIDSISSNCYPGTSVLINKFDIHDEAKLLEVESTISSIRHAEWINSPLVHSFDFAHYKAIHQHLFSDIYDWAGEVRTVNISKKGTCFTNFSDIESQAEQIFLRLAACNYFKNLSHTEFVEEIVDFYSVTNILHPFREKDGTKGDATISTFHYFSHREADFFMPFSA